MLIVIIDCEGEPVQELSAIYCDTETAVIKDVFHHHVYYPHSRDFDNYARRHIHGLNFVKLRQKDLLNEKEVLALFSLWLKTHPFDVIYAHAPAKEQTLLNVNIKDACLKPWCERVNMPSHQRLIHLLV